MKLVQSCGGIPQYRKENTAAKITRILDIGEAIC